MSIPQSGPLGGRDSGNPASGPPTKRHSDPDDALVGGLFARDFRVIRRLRSGGMGSVFIVEQVSTGKQRALKLLAPGLADNPDIRERFVREARSASSIDSDHVVEIVSAGVDEASGAPYLVMELLRGEDLADHVENSGPMAPAAVIEVLCQVGHALDLAHQQGIVHRDLKPENIFLATSRRGDGAVCAKILDFGVAKLLTGNAQNAGTMPVGSPGYMAPEQTDAFGQITPSADVWSLALVAFYLLTGRSYWLAGIDASIPALLREVCFDPLDSPSVRAEKLGVDVTFPPGFDEWFLRCVDRDIEQRFPDGGAATQALKALIDAPAPVVPEGPASDPGDVRRSSSGSGLSLPPRASSGGRLAKSGAMPILIAGAVASAVGAVVAFVFVSARPPAAPAAAPSASATESAVGTGSPREDTAPIRPSLARKPQASAGPASPKDQEDAAELTAPPLPLVDSGPCPRDMGHHPRSKTGPAFCLERREVSVRAYLRCVAKSGCERLTQKAGTEGQPTKVNYSALCASKPSDLPINCVSFAAAEKFCAAAGRRLPSEREWLDAAGSVDLKAPDESKLNACGEECVSWGYDKGLFLAPLFAGSDGFEATAPSGSFPAGMAKAGEVDLFGNVAEWVVTDAGSERVARGGSFMTGKPEQLSERLTLPAEATSHVVGFRCAMDLKE